jgi:hypothetical protein
MAKSASGSDLYRQVLSSHQKLRSKLKQQAFAAEPLLPPSPYKQKTKKSGRPHSFIRGNWQGSPA